jgi:hypothetical protein
MVDAAFRGFTAIPASGTGDIEARPKPPCMRYWLSRCATGSDRGCGKGDAAQNPPGRRRECYRLSKCAGGYPRGHRGHLISPNTRILSLVVQVEDGIGAVSPQADWLRRRRSSTNEPIASPPSAMTGMMIRALRIVPPHSRSGWIVPTALDQP